MVEQTVMGSATRSSQVQLERERMRAEMSGPTGDTQIIVFDGPQQVLRIISPSRKTYSEMTKADADRMGGQMAIAMAAMKEKMATMPPEQRAKMEAMMAQPRRRRAGAAKPEYRRTGSDKVGKWACDKYEGFRNGQKVSEVCTVEPKVLGLTMADFEVTKQVACVLREDTAEGMDQMRRHRHVRSAGVQRHSRPPCCLQRRQGAGDQRGDGRETRELRRRHRTKCPPDSETGGGGQEAR